MATTNTVTTVPQTDVNLEQINTDNDSNDYQVKWGLLNNIITNTGQGQGQGQTVATPNTMNFTQGSEQTISNITDLQTIEMQLYEGLDSPQLTQDQRSRIIDKINEIAQTRMTLYQGIGNMASSYQQNLATSNNALSEQMLAIDIIENELNEAKRRLNLLEEQKYNKLRLVEINTYYGKQYNAYKDVAKNIVYVCILVLIVVILGKKEIIPGNIYIALNVLIISIGAIIIGRQIIKLSNKDNMNFDEYDWYFNKAEAPSSTTLTDPSSSSSSNPWSMPTITCMGATCCNQADGFTYDSTQNMCVLNTTTSTTANTTSANTTSPNTTSPNTTTPTTPTSSS
jgi:hypothetical protein